MSVKQPNYYLRFVNLVQGLMVDKRLINIEPTTRQLLDEIALQHSSQTPMTVSRLMSLDHIASPATLHRKMQALIENGLIELSVDKENKRTKFVLLSKRGSRHFDALSEVMLQAVGRK